MFNNSFIFLGQPHFISHVESAECDVEIPGIATNGASAGWAGKSAQSSDEHFMLFPDGICTVFTSWHGKWMKLGIWCSIDCMFNSGNGKLGSLFSNKWEQVEIIPNI